MSIYAPTSEDLEIFESLKSYVPPKEALIPIPNNLSKRGEFHPLYGVGHTEESRALMSESQKSSPNHATRGKCRPDHSMRMSGAGNPMHGVTSPRKGVKVPTSTCPHCGKVGGIFQLKQWHFDKCKFKK